MSPADGSETFAVGVVAPEIFMEIICSDFCRSLWIIRPNRYHLFTAEGDSQENPLQLENPMQLGPLNATTGKPEGRVDPNRRDLLMEKAKSLEAAFLSEMLSHAGLEGAEGPFSGGIGEQQFASFLREAQAKSIVEHGGIGLAEHLFQSLVKNDHATE